jgi:hypothetical protein
MIFTLPRSTTSTTTHSRSSSGGTAAGGIPLIDFSRTPSPTRSSAAPSSSDADDHDYDYDGCSGDDGDAAAAAATAYPSGGPSRTAYRARTAARGTRRSDVLNNLLRPADGGGGGGGGIGAFLFGTWTGWQVYACAVGAWYVAAGVWLAVVNRVVLWSGVYKYGSDGQGDSGLTDADFRIR